VDQLNAGFSAQQLNLPSRNVNVDRDDTVTSSNDGVGIMVVSTSINISLASPALTVPFMTYPLAQEPIEMTHLGSGI
jgi:hypothetical protein